MKNRFRSGWGHGFASGVVALSGVFAGFAGDFAMMGARILLVVLLVALETRWTRRAYEDIDRVCRVVVPDRIVRRVVDDDRPSSPDDPGTCDWGRCARRSGFRRRDPTSGSWLPVCREHRAPVVETLTALRTRIGDEKRV